MASKSTKYQKVADTVLEAWAMKEPGLRREDISHPSMKTEMQIKESMGTIGRHRLLVLKKIARDSEPQLVWQVGRYLPEVWLEL